MVAPPRRINFTPWSNGGPVVVEPPATLSVEEVMDGLRRRGVLAGPYLEPDTKTHVSTSAAVEALEEQLSPILDKPCPGGLAIGLCDDGHPVGKELWCGLDWDLYCGGNHGLKHRERMARWLDKAKQIDRMGRFVFTTPPRLRYWLQDVRELAKVATSIKRMLCETFGYQRGLGAWHLFGDDHQDAGEGVPGFHPHREVLVDGGYMQSGTLESVKRGYWTILENLRKRLVAKCEGEVPAQLQDPIRPPGPGGEVDLWYQYGRRTSFKAHKLSYALRPTFNDWRWHPWLALSLVKPDWEYKTVRRKGEPARKDWVRIKFRRMQAWGGPKAWSGPAVWDLPPDLEEELAKPAQSLRAVTSGLCPQCGKSVHWIGVQPFSITRKGYWRKLEDGVYLANAPPEGSEVRRSYDELYAWLYGGEAAVAAHHARGTSKDC